VYFVLQYDQFTVLCCYNYT